MLVPHGALVLVLDGAHARVLRNRGSETLPDLEVVPGDRLHRYKGDGGDHGHRHLREVIEAIAPLLSAGAPLILIAPPEQLGVLRTVLPPQARQQVVAEMPKDLARCPPQELASRLHLART